MQVLCEQAKRPDVHGYQPTVGIPELRKAMADWYKPVSYTHLVYKFLQQFYSNIDYYIPDRYNEGYGVAVKGVDYACETGVKLIIVLECGIKAVEEIAYAKEKGIDFIICDHHVPDDILPPAVAILNAKRADKIGRAHV